ncbi:hypothetical protein K9N68_26475 [Kovacikia minuta CCNUW1]|uniref:slr1957 family protein n=1 Tax=Kovacikia minuta TaxID=2931930 RepID=UPI001CCBCB6B|nr:hypothetical protein [Kovacikia minuta]UBF25146.1 hypothetical protein K9N68_26475 [Kovacikia minuta CCNUW1]
MNHYSAQWIEEWCQDNGWTDWFMECSRYWAFPPNGVMPVPIPTQVLRTIKAEKGLCFEEKIWCLMAVLIALLASISTYFLASPMPLVVAFAFCAVTVARMEDDTLESTPSEGGF